VTRRNLFLCQTLVGLVLLSGALPAGAIERIRIRGDELVGDTITIDETLSPPMITVSAGVAVSGAPGSLQGLGGGQYRILVAGNAYYHLKAKGAVDTITVIDGPGSSRYWLGAGADDDTVSVQDGPGNDEYTIEGKGGDDVYEIFDDSGNGDDAYFVKTASGDDLLNITDGPGDDLYHLKGTPDVDLVFTDAGGDADTIRSKGIPLP